MIVADFRLRISIGRHIHDYLFACQSEKHDILSATRSHLGCLKDGFEYLLSPSFDGLKMQFAHFFTFLLE